MPASTFRDRVIWITGASSGIGEALAVAFAAEGAKLVLSARRREELERVAARCTAAAPQIEAPLVLQLDVTDHEAMPGAVDSVVGRFGRIDMLINNAGLSQRSKCVDTDLAVYRTLLEVDVLGPIALTKAVLPLMLEQGSGHIAVTSSVAGKVGAPYRTGYCAAKHAVMGFFDSLRAEVAPRGIGVTTIVPGFVRTGIARAALSGTGAPFGRTDRYIAEGMDPDRAAAVILRGLRRGRLEIPVGEGIEMHALWLRRLFPNLLLRHAHRFGKPEDN